MIRIRKSTDRGHADLGWLDSRHTFSFADYHNPEQMGFRCLRVINDDHVNPGSGFGEHSHGDMEIVSYVLDGSLAHRDSMGNGSVLSGGDVQVMTAGTGIHHSEMNPSLEEPVHFLQIWIQVARGEVSVNGRNLAEGDGAAISNQQAIQIAGRMSAEILLFDLG